LEHITEVPIHSTTYSSNREIIAVIDIVKELEYIIIPSTFEQNIEETFVLAIFSEKTLIISKLLHDKKEKKKRGEDPMPKLKSGVHKSDQGKSNEPTASASHPNKPIEIDDSNAHTTLEISRNNVVEHPHNEPLTDNATHEAIVRKVNFPNGDYFEGTYVNGKRNGKGTYHYHDGSSYVGDYSNDQRHGQGIYILPDGSKYTGQFKNGRSDGEGIQTFIKGGKVDTYKGQFTQDKFHGKGTYTSSSGWKYEGEWRDNQMCGQGIYYYPSGNRVEGQFSAGQPNGLCTAYYKNGTVKQGNFKNGQLQENA